MQGLILIFNQELNLIFNYTASLYYDYSIKNKLFELNTQCKIQDKNPNLSSVFQLHFNFLQNIDLVITFLHYLQNPLTKILILLGFFKEFLKLLLHSTKVCNLDVLPLKYLSAFLDSSLFLNYSAVFIV